MIMKVVILKNNTSNNSSLSVGNFMTWIRNARYISYELKTGNWKILKS